MTICYRAVLVFSLLLQAQQLCAQSVDCAPECFCNTLSDGSGLVRVDCNRQSINTVMAFFREAGVAGSLSQVTFLAAPEAALEAGVFEGMTELRSLTINFCVNLTEIQPGAFNSLPMLQALQIQRNSLEWLSVESFEGIGSSLRTLDLEDNHLRSLHSNLEPFFASISVISLSDNIEFVCDCHLQWLPQFIDNHSGTLDQTGAFCAEPVRTPLATANYSVLQCQDICTLGYHSCSDNATCSVIGDIFACSCDSGFVGNGLQCVASHLCEVLVCSEHAVCVSGPVPGCVCEPGYTGNGFSCVVLDQCEQACSEDSDLYCILNGESGRIDCGSEQVQQLQQTLLVLSADPSLDPGLVMFSTELVLAAMNTSFPGDIPAIVDLLALSVSILKDRNQFINTSFSNLVEVGSELLHLNKQPLWNEINTTSVSDHITDLFLSIENLGEALFANSGGENFMITSDNIALVVATPDCENAESITISSSLLTSPVEGGDSSLQLPPTIFGTEYNCTEVGVIAVVYNGVGPLLNLDNELIPNCTSTPAPLVYDQCQWSNALSVCLDLQVNSVIISAEAVRSSQNQSVDQLNTTVLIDPIIITLRHENITLTNPVCSFLTEEQTQMNGNWMSDGCALVAMDSNTSVTVCECYHLTSFALLMSPTGPTNASQALQIVSKIGLCISILCLLLTVILLFGLKLETKLHHVHRQLALALCLAQLLFLIAVDRTLVPSPDYLCTLIAALLHYLFLCTFAWQLVEGVHLYLFIVKVFFNKKIVWLYYPFAWGAPLIVVAITMGLRFCDYGSEHYCWITGDGVNWAFHGPVIAVLLINIVIMLIVTVIIVRVAKKKSRDNYLLCTLLHASFVLVPILGITWLLGFFVVGESTFAEVVEWLFCIFTAMQGVFIFFMHCILNKEVRKAFLKKVGCREAAQRQQRLTLRRSSTTQSFSSFSIALKKTFYRRRSSTGDITSLSVEQSISSRGFTVARPQSANARIRGGVVNPLVKIEEEGESLPNSLSGSPMIINKLTVDPPTTTHPSQVNDSTNLPEKALA